MKLLYKATYFAKDENGDELFSKERYFSDRKKAFDYLFNVTSEVFPKTLADYLYPDLVALYTHVTAYGEQDGEYKYIKSAIYSYSAFEDGHRVYQCNEPKLTYIP